MGQRYKMVGQVYQRDHGRLLSFLIINRSRCQAARPLATGTGRPPLKTSPNEREEKGW